MTSRPTFLAGCLAALLLAMSAPPAPARLIENWPYARLFKEADLVVIAEATAVAPTGEKAKLGWGADFLGVNTTFAVKHSLKGAVKGDTLRVLHYRPKDGALFQNGPLLVSFRLKGATVRGKGLQVQTGKPHYLLFLKRRPDGRYEPVSGQVDPLLSVKEIHGGGLTNALDGKEARP
jgi:hypothetical protein